MIFMSSARRTRVPAGPRGEGQQPMVLFGQEHVDRYEATGGEDGHDWRGTTTLILTTTGRKSGETRKTPLIYQEWDGAYLVVASKGGWPHPPAWYLNLEANPHVEVQVKGDRFKARARTATPDEKPEMWKKMVATWPAYDEYQEKTAREIPVGALERRERLRRRAHLFGEAELIDRGVAHLELLHLASDRHRELLDEADIARHLEVRDPPAAVGAHVVLVQ